MRYKTELKGVMCLFDENNKFVAVVMKDENSRHNVFHSVKEMDMQALERFMSADTVKIKNQPVVLPELIVKPVK